MDTLGITDSKANLHLIPRSHSYEKWSPWNSLSSILRIPQNRYWLESKRSNISIKDGQLVPWISYPALHFIENIDFSDLRVVEFGSGASSIFFSSRSKKLISYEFDFKYFEIMNKLCAIHNFEIVEASTFWDLDKDLKPLDTYFDTCLRNDKKHLESLLRNNPKASDEPKSPPKRLIDQSFQNLISNIEQADFIFIDGGPRNFLTALCSKHAKDDACILIDNSDSEYVQFALASLRQEGYYEIPFLGLGPLNPYEWQTSIFVRDLKYIEKNSK